MRQSSKTKFPLFKIEASGISPIACNGVSKLLYKNKVCETHIIPLMPLVHQPRMGYISSLLPHLRNWGIDFDGGYLLKHPGTGELNPALLTFGADPAEANTLAVMAGFEWVLHMFFFQGSLETRERGSFGHGHTKYIRWYFKKEIHN